MKYLAVCIGVLLVSLLMVPAISAAGDYYCSADVLTGGQGIAAEPSTSSMRASPKCVAPAAAPSTSCSPAVTSLTR